MQECHPDILNLKREMSNGVIIVFNVTFGEWTQARTHVTSDLFGYAFRWLAMHLSKCLQLLATEDPTC